MSGFAWNTPQSTPSMLGQPYGRMLGTPLVPDYGNMSAITDMQANGSPFGGAGGGMPAAGGNGLLGWLSNYQNLGTVVQGLGGLTSAYLGFQQMKQAKEALGLQKEAFNANLNNSISTYNTSLEDRIRGRTSNYEGKESDVQAYLAQHSLSR